MCSFCRIFFYFDSAFAYGWSVWRGLWRCPALWQVSGSSRTLRLTWQPASSSHSCRQAGGKNESPDGWEETLPFIWPHWCGRCREVTEKAEKAGAAENDAKCPLSSGSTAKGQHSERCPPLARNTEHMYPWHDSASEELHSRVKELTFKEQAAWFPSVSCTWYSPAAPGKQIQSSVFPCQAHMQWNSLILIASLH